MASAKKHISLAIHVKYTLCTREEKYTKKPRCTYLNLASLICLRVKYKKTIRICCGDTRVIRVQKHQVKYSINLSAVLVLHKNNNRVYMCVCFKCFPAQIEERERFVFDCCRWFVKSGPIHVQEQKLPKKAAFSCNMARYWNILLDSTIPNQGYDMYINNHHYLDTSYRSREAK